MDTTTSSNPERLEIRVSSLDKRLFKRAQELSGDKTISSFVLRILRQHAQQIIKEKDGILLTEKDRELFFESVFNEIDPNEYLTKAAEKYKAKFSGK